MNETELARMVVRLLGDSTSYIRMLTQSNAATRVATNEIMIQSARIEGYQQSILGLASNVKFAFLSAIGVVGLFGTAMGAIQKSASGEQIELAFEVLVGNALLAKKTLGDLRQFAAETPFELPEILEAAKQMIAFGQSAENIVPVMRMLGDVASGVNAPLGSLIYLFGTLKAQGIAHTIDIMQFATRGIPIWENLSLVLFGVKERTADVRNEVEKSRVTFAHVEQAFKLMTSEGGKFGGMMARQSTTLAGLWSTFKDEVGATLRIIGDEIVRSFNLKEALQQFIGFAGEIKRWVAIAADGFVFLKNQVVELVRSNMDLIITAAKVAGALFGVWAAIKAGTLAVGIIAFLISALKIDLIVSTAVWLAWGAAVMLVKGVLTLTTAFLQTVWIATVTGAKLAVLAFNAAMVIGEAIYGSVLATLAGVGGFVMPMYTLNALAATAATWLLNAALTVMDVLLAPVTIVAAAAAFGVLASAALLAVAAISVVAAGLIAAWQAGKTFVAVMMELGNQAAGPLAQIAPMFAEWGNLISDLTRAIQVDFALAWRLVEAYARLAVEQIKVLWPPLWTFIQTGFDIIWTETTRRLKQAFYQAILDIYDVVVKVGKEIAKIIINIRTDPGGFIGGKFNADIAKVGEELQGKIAENAGKHWQMQVDEAADKLRKAWANLDQAGIVGAKENIQKMRDEMEIDEWLKGQLQLIDEDEMAKIGKAGQEAANQGLMPIEKAAKHAHQAVQELKGALVNSNEGYQRLLEQRDFLEGRGLGRAAVDPKTGRIQIDMQKSEKILGMIASNTNPKNNPPPLILQAAGI